MKHFPSGFIAGFLAICSTAFANPEIVVMSYEHTVIPDGSVPNGFSGTDFSQVLVSGGQVNLTIWIANSGNALLTIPGPITVSGPNAAEFTAGTAAAIQVAPGNSQSMDIRFNPSATGVRTGVVTIGSNASNSSYSFTVTGTGVNTLTARPDLRISTKRLPKAKLDKKTGNVKVSVTMRVESYGPVAVDEMFAAVFSSAQYYLDPSTPPLLMVPVKALPALIPDKPVKGRNVKFKFDAGAVENGMLFARIIPLTPAADSKFENNQAIEVFQVPE